MKSIGNADVTSGICLVMLSDIRVPAPSFLTSSASEEVVIVEPGIDDVVVVSVSSLLPAATVVVDSVCAVLVVSCGGDDGFSWLLRIVEQLRGGLKRLVAQGRLVDKFDSSG